MQIESRLELKRRGRGFRLARQQTGKQAQRRDGSHWIRPPGSGPVYHVVTRNNRSMSTQAATVPVTLPASYYTAPEVFRAEMERFYFRTWICAGRTEQISNAGDYFLRNFAGESVIITRDTGGVARAFFNVCRHRGTRMCTVPQGAFAGRISCPYHGWAYGLDGSLLGAPHMDESGFSRADYPLHPVRAAVWDGHIFI